MNIEKIKDVLENDFDQFGSILKVKYKQNVNEIARLEKKQIDFDSELEEVFVSVGLDNCVSSLREITELNERLKEIDRYRMMNNTLSVMLQKYKEKATEGKVSQKLQENIKKCEEEIASNKKAIKALGTKKDINQKINECHNNISQSMIVLTEEQEDKVIDVYKQHAVITNRITKLKNDNDELSKAFKDLKLENKVKSDEIKIDLFPTQDISKKEEKIEILEEPKKEEVKDLEQIDISQTPSEEIKEEPIETINLEEMVETLDDKALGNTNEEIIKEERPKRYHFFGKDFETIDEYREYYNNMIDENSNEKETVDNDKLRETRKVLREYKKGPKKQETKTKVGLPPNEKIKNELRYRTTEVSKLINDTYYKTHDNINENNSEYNRKRILDYIAKKYNINVEGTYNVTDEEFVNMVLDQACIDKEEFENIIKEISPKVEVTPATETKPTKKLSADAILMDYFNITKDQLYNYNKDELINLIAFYFGESPSETKAMTEEEFLQKIADHLNISIEELNRMDVNTINTIIRRSKTKATFKDNLNYVVEDIKNARIIKDIKKLSKDFSNALMTKVKSSLGSVKAGMYEELDNENTDEMKR